MWTLRGLTVGEGPIQVGYSHSNLTTTMIAEKLDSAVSDPGQILLMEHSRRPVRQVGFISGIAANQSLNDGQNVRTKIKFIVGETHRINFWARNLSGASLTTGAVLDIAGTIFARWL